MLFGMKLFTKNTPALIPLSDAEVDALQQKFLRGIDARADKIVAQITGADDSLRESVRDFILLATRLKLVDYSDKAITAYAQNGLDALKAAYAQAQDIPDAEIKRAELLEQFGENFRIPVDKSTGAVALSPDQETNMWLAQRSRREIAAVAQTFGDKERLYFKLETKPSATQATLAAFLQGSGFTITDYKNGFCTDAIGKQQFRIGKLLRQLGEETLLDAFMNDAARHDGLLMVVSRNAKDITFMSTNRGWGSCMSALGLSFEYTAEDVRQGSLVAYLISPNDPEINNPLARIALRPFDNLTRRQTAYRAFNEGDTMSGLFNLLAEKLERKKTHVPRTILLAEKPYGFQNDIFEKTVDAFLQTHINNGAAGTFKIRQGVYMDGKRELTLRAGRMLNVKMKSVF